MRVAAASLFVSLAGCVPVDAIDQTAAECEQAMLPRILEKANLLPGDDVLRARNVKIEHWLVGGERRLEAIQAKVIADWKATEVQPVNEITYALFLREDAAGFQARARKRTKELCAFAEANRVKYEKWSYGGDGLGGFVRQGAENNVIEELPSE